MYLCTVWLGNRLGAMEFPGGLKAMEDITDRRISGADLVALR